MTIVRIDTNQWASGLEAASETYSLIGPIKDKNGYKFKSLAKGELPDLDFTNTTLSPKEFLFPQSEKIIEYSFDKSCENNNNMKVVKKNYSDQAIIGIRPCDAKANNILQLNFDTKDVKDPYWLKSKESTTFIGLACDNPCINCFCTKVDSGPYNTEGLDILILPKKNEHYYAKIITIKGENFIKKTGWKTIAEKDFPIFDDYKKIAEAKILSKISTDKLEKLEILDLYNASFWNDVSFACINCGICTFSCPTCWCFDIQDEVHGKDGSRMKNWDSCMFPIFTVHTTGHNPRETKMHRIRQRFMHKLKYFVDKYNSGIMCVGCGRCIQNCPVNIDIRKICNLMNSFKSDGPCTV